MSTLFLVATPIGNLQDISPRALEILRAVSCIAAEDTRTAKQLLNYFGIHTPVTSFFEHSKQAKLEHLLDLLRAGDVAVISEAGMPGINDPGEALVRAAIERGHRISPIPGPSAVLTALMASGDRRTAACRRRRHFRGFPQSTLQSGGRYDLSSFRTPPITNSHPAPKAFPPKPARAAPLPRGQQNPRRAADAVQDEQQRQATTAGVA